MVRRSVVMLAVLAMTVALTSAAYAQAVTASLSGVLTDESGGVLPGASVTATQTSTGAKRTVVTGSNGEYIFTSLPIGPYKLAATMPGFNAFEQTGITLNVGDTRSVNISLKVGAMAETVSVRCRREPCADAELERGAGDDAGTDRRSAAERPQCHAAPRAGGRRGRSGHLGPRPALPRGGEHFRRRWIG